MVHKYAVAIVSILLTAVQFVKGAIGDGFDAAEAWQLVALVAAGVLAWRLPLFGGLGGKWPGLLKTGITIIGALATAIVPFALQGTITPEQITTVALAALTALGVEVGVNARTDIIDAGTYDPETGAVITSLDPQGEKALGKEQYAFIAPDVPADEQAAAAVSAANGRHAKS